MADPTPFYQGVADQNNADTIVYLGAINRLGYDKVTSFLKKKPEREKRIYCFLGTYGGDPAAAYRIARALRNHYEEIFIVVPTFCKSAGTLMAVGACELIIADTGELGPLDIQLKKTDELFGSQSGLDITQALTYLNKQASEVLGQALYDLNGRYSISTKTAADIATKFATSALSPIYGQIDPLRLGEINRALSIAFQYGKRLNKMSEILKDSDQTLKKLMMDYPDHGFVIDRKEAGELFTRVSKPVGAILEACDATYQVRHVIDSQEPFVELFHPAQNEEQQVTESLEDKNTVLEQSTSGTDIAGICDSDE